MDARTPLTKCTEHFFNPEKNTIVALYQLYDAFIADQKILQFPSRNDLKSFNATLENLTILLEIYQEVSDPGNERYRTAWTAHLIQQIWDFHQPLSSQLSNKEAACYTSLQKFQTECDLNTQAEPNTSSSEIVKNELNVEVNKFTEESFTELLKFKPESNSDEVITGPLRSSTRSTTGSSRSRSSSPPIGTSPPIHRVKMTALPNAAVSQQPLSLKEQFLGLWLAFPDANSIGRLQAVADAVKSRKKHSPHRLCKIIESEREGTVYLALMPSEQIFEELWKSFDPLLTKKPVAFFSVATYCEMHYGGFPISLVQQHHCKHRTLPIGDHAQENILPQHLLWAVDTIQKLGAEGYRVIIHGGLDGLSLNLSLSSKKESKAAIILLLLKIIEDYQDQKSWNPQLKIQDQLKNGIQFLKKQFAATKFEVDLNEKILSEEDWENITHLDDTNSEVFEKCKYLVLGAQALQMFQDASYDLSKAYETALSFPMSAWVQTDGFIKFMTTLSDKMHSKLLSAETVRKFLFAFYTDFNKAAQSYSEIYSEFHFGFLNETPMEVTIKKCRGESNPIDKLFEELATNKSFFEADFDYFHELWCDFRNYRASSCKYFDSPLRASFKEHKQQLAENEKLIENPLAGIWEKYFNEDNKSILLSKIDLSDGYRKELSHIKHYLDEENHENLLANFLSVMALYVEHFFLSASTLTARMKKFYLKVMQREGYPFNVILSNTLKPDQPVISVLQEMENVYFTLACIKYSTSGYKNNKILHEHNKDTVQLLFQAMRDIDYEEKDVNLKLKLQLMVFNKCINAFTVALGTLAKKLGSGESMETIIYRDMHEYVCELEEKARSSNNATVRLAKLKRQKSVNSANTLSLFKPQSYTIPSILIFLYRKILERAVKYKSHFTRVREPSFESSVSYTSSSSTTIYAQSKTGKPITPPTPPRHTSPSSSQHATSSPREAPAMIHLLDVEIEENNLNKEDASLPSINFRPKASNEKFLKQEDIVKVLRELWKILGSLSLQAQLDGIRRWLQESIVREYTTDVTANKEIFPEYDLGLIRERILTSDRYAMVIIKMIKEHVKELEERVANPSELPLESSAAVTTLCVSNQ